MEVSRYIGVEDVLEKQFLEEEKLGMCFRTSDEEAKRRWPGKKLRVASIGAIEKSDDTFRIIHDGTHGIRVNNDARMRDRLRLPGPKEERHIISTASQSKGP